MKINEKNLSAFAVSATPVDKEGYLLKRSEVQKTYQKRYFILKGNLLFYFEKKGDKEPLGVVVLEGCTIELDDEDDEQFTFKIVFHGPHNRSYVLGADSHDTMEDWMKVLACAGYDYMKLMVAELQRQLDDIDSPALVATASSLLGPTPPPRQQRFNPFNNNKSDSNHSSSAVLIGGGPHQRSHSLRGNSSSVRNCGAEEKIRMNEGPKNCTSSNTSSTSTITFRELHNLYGRPILTDFNIWKHDQNQPKIVYDLL